MTPTPESNPTPEQEKEIRFALREADSCLMHDEGDCGTGAIVLAAAYRSQEKRIRELGDDLLLSELRENDQCDWHTPNCHVFADQTFKRVKDLESKLARCERLVKAAVELTPSEGIWEKEERMEYDEVQIDKESLAEFRSAVLEYMLPIAAAQEAPSER